MAKKERKHDKYELATFDLETDPFLYGRVPRPFVVGFYSYSTGFLYFWGDNCIRDFINFLYNQSIRFKLYAHNGGRFDFHYLLEQEVIENPVKIINRKIAKFKIGHHEVRDSVRILPIRLADYQKDDIDYQKLERNKREKYRGEILSYLKTDCMALFELVEKFRERFGDKLTIGGVAMDEIKTMYNLSFPFGEKAEIHDAKFRQFYFGGRTEAFRKGIFNGDFAVYDINSSYPDTMAHCLHPIGLRYCETGNLSALNDYKENWPFFIDLNCYSFGAFPLRTKEALLFPHGYGNYKITGHEFNMAVKLGLIDDISVNKIYIPAEAINFKDFIYKYAQEKIDAKLANDIAAYIFSKILQNSGYGKFATNPESYMDYYIRNPGDPRPDITQWTLSEWSGEFEIWCKPAVNKQFYDVATGASITGASRAKLMPAIALNKSVFYCDTDSVIIDRNAGEFIGGEIHPTKLGAWDCENTGDSLAIAGKKLYALFNKGEGVKKAHKGSVLDFEDILEIANISGNSVLWANPVPSFSLTGDAHFIEREIVRI